MSDKTRRPDRPNIGKGRKMTKPTRILAISAVAIMALTGLAVIATARTSSGPLDEWRNNAVAVDTPAVEQLDQIPGLGYSVEAALADELVGAWEAYRRQSIISDCMTAAGFSYLAELRYPAGVIPAVRDYAEARLGKDAPVPTEAQKGELSPDENNAMVRESISPEERDRYWRALVGESSANVEFFESNDGQPPEGRGDDFATTGCSGEATDAVPSVWALRTRVYDAIAADGPLPIDKDSSDQLAACTGLNVASLDELERHLEKDPDLGAKVEPCVKEYGLKRTAAALERLLATAELFERDLVEQQKVYESIEAQILADTDFVELLFVEAARIDDDFSKETHHDGPGE